MNKIVQLILITLLVLPSIFASAEDKDLKEIITSGKWVNRSGGYVPVPTYNPEEAGEYDNITTQKRFKTFGFEENNTFILDSVKQRYTGTYTISNGKVVLNFKPKELTHLRTNKDPNSAGNQYQTIQETVKLPQRTLTLTDEGKLKGDGYVYKNYSGAFSGLFNFYEFSGFANVTWKHIIMMLVGFFFIFLAIKYDFEPLLLIPIGFGVLIGNIPMFQAVDFNLKLGV
ncbi:MAG TPA: sodium ion-translocating decarboxylase subunit beta, partial [Prolixibacteraceae bacterium]|nr:sodium ion-translocating decarboxylase subunit beta [Prolixibacteraceae bacterium]